MPVTAPWSRQSKLAGRAARGQAGAVSKRGRSAGSTGSGYEWGMSSCKQKMPVQPAPTHLPQLLVVAVREGARPEDRVVRPPPHGLQFAAMTGEEQEAAPVLAQRAVLLVETVHVLVEGGHVLLRHALFRRKGGERGDQVGGLLCGRGRAGGRPVDAASREDEQHADEHQQQRRLQRVAAGRK